MVNNKGSKRLTVINDICLRPLAYKDSDAFLDGVASLVKTFSLKDKVFYRVWRHLPERVHLSE